MAEMSRKRADILVCPHCGNEVGVTLMEAARIEPCPHCGQAMVLPSVDGSTEVPEPAFAIIDDEAEEDDATAMERLRRQREERLNSLRIASLAGERRALHRRRTFTLGWGVVLMIGALQGILLIVRNAGEPDQRSRLLALAVLSVGAIYFGLRAFRRAAALSQQLRQPLQSLPDQSPDFAPLSDGSQHWKNLEKL